MFLLFVWLLLLSLFLLLLMFLLLLYVLLVLVLVLALALALALVLALVLVLVLVLLLFFFFLFLLLLLVLLLLLLLMMLSLLLLLLVRCRGTARHRREPPGRIRAAASDERCGRRRDAGRRTRRREDARELAYYAFHRWSWRICRRLCRVTSDQHLLKVFLCDILPHLFIGDT